jgi:type IV pilus assembly protein PilV
MRIRQQRSTPARPRFTGSAVRGFVMLEALIAAVIFSIGVLGLVSLQASMTQSQTLGKFRGDAIYLADELVGLIWTDLPRATSYASASCSGYARCSDWQGKLGRTLPGATSNVSVNGTTGLVNISITWVTQSATQNYATSTKVMP